MNLPYKKLAPSTGLRNRLVLEYEEIDNKIVFESISTTLELYKQYIEEIKNLIENKHLTVSCFFNLIYNRIS